MLKINKRQREGFTVFGLSGRIEAEQIPELQKLLGPAESFGKVILDLADTRLVDREVVVFFVDCEAKGMKLENCPAYVRKWMAKEKH